MLNIYLGKNNIPQDKSLVYDTDAFCSALSLEDTPFIRKVISTVEQGEYLDSATFTDRFGRALYANQMSTSSKILIAVYTCPEYVFMCDEIGLNAIDLLLDIENGNILFNRFDIEFQDDMKFNISVNGKTAEDTSELNVLMGGY